MRRLAVLLAFLVLLTLTSGNAHPGPGRDSHGRPMPPGPLTAGTAPSVVIATHHVDHPATVIHFGRS